MSDPYAILHPYLVRPPLDVDVAQPFAELVATSAGVLIVHATNDGGARHVAAVDVGTLLVGAFTRIDSSSSAACLALKLPVYAQHREFAGGPLIDNPVPDTPATSDLPVVPSDAADQPDGPFLGLLAESDGVVAFIVGDSGRLPITVAVTAGERVGVPVARVLATGTTAVVRGTVPYALLAYAAVPARGITVDYLGIIATTPGDVVVEFAGIAAPQFARLDTGDMLAGPRVLRISPKSTAALLAVPGAA